MASRRRLARDDLHLQQLGFSFQGVSTAIGPSLFCGHAVADDALSVVHLGLPLKLPCPALSTATISAPPSGIFGCNSASATARDENSVRILSADTAACSAGGLNASAGPLDFRDRL